MLFSQSDTGNHRSAPEPKTYARPSMSGRENVSFKVSSRFAAFIRAFKVTST